MLCGINGFLTFLLAVFICYSFFSHTLILIQNAETKTDTHIKLKYQYYSLKYYIYIRYLTDYKTLDTDHMQELSVLAHNSFLLMKYACERNHSSCVLLCAHVHVCLNSCACRSQRQMLGAFSITLHLIFGGDRFWKTYPTAYHCGLTVFPHEPRNPPVFASSALSRSTWPRACF